MLALALLISGQLSAHGILWEESAKKPYGIEFGYDDGSAMSFVEVKVFGPDDETNLYQSGRTSGDGYFAFIPNADGKYLVVADDENGHIIKAEMDIKTMEGAVSGGDAPEAPAVNVERTVERAVISATKPYKMVVVILSIITLGLIWKLYLSKKKESTAPARPGV
jgi:hypothetical protein